jgi:plastocyanin
MSRTPPVLLVLTAVLVLAGCSKQEPEFVANDQVPAEQRTTEAPTPGAGGEQQPPGQVQGTWVVEGAELAYDQAPTTLPAGNVTIQLQNIAGLQHDVTFEGVRNERPIVEVNGRGTDTGTVELEPDTYTYYCSVPGHREAGMEGTVTVQ